MSSRTAYGVDVQTEREAGFLTCEFLTRTEKLAAPNEKFKSIYLSIYPWEKERERERLAPSSFNVSFDHVVHVDTRDGKSSLLLFFSLRKNETSHFRNFKFVNFDFSTLPSGGNSFSFNDFRTLTIQGGL